MRVACLSMPALSIIGVARAVHARGIVDRGATQPEASRKNRLLLWLLRDIMTAHFA